LQRLVICEINEREEGGSAGATERENAIESEEDRHSARARERERERESAKALVRLSTDVLEKTIAGASIRLSLRATNHLQA